MAIIFSKGGMSDLTLERGRIFPIQSPIQINQERHFTESMNPKVIVYSGTAEFFELKLEGLSRDNYDGTVNGLKTWFENALINWSENNFTLVDEEGNSLTVRLWQDNFNPQEESANRYSISLTLLKE